MDLWLAYEAGAYPGSPVGAGVMYSVAPYAVENFNVDGYDVVVNKPKVAAYRAPGTPQAAFAMEQVIDELAHELDMDPMALRLKNVQREGGRQVISTVHQFPKSGDMYIFPAGLRHWVFPFKSKVERISVSGNLLIDADSRMNYYAGK